MISPIEISQSNQPKLQIN